MNERRQHLWIASASLVLLMGTLAGCGSSHPGGGLVDGNSGPIDVSLVSSQEASSLTEGGLSGLHDGGGLRVDGIGCGLRTCATAHATCGPIGDGCGGVLECGTCTAPATCGGGGVPSVCGGTSVCVAKTCADFGFSCGPAGDGCGGMLNCGTCTAPATCGGGSVRGACGASDGGGRTCVPLTCAELGFSCGPAGNGCGGMLNCGSCTSPASCGGGGKAGVCGTPTCTPRTCATAGASCGAVGDGCGGILSCGTCPTGEVCGGGGVPNVCSGAPDGGTCTNLCLKQVKCEGGTTTTVSGTVYAPTDCSLGFCAAGVTTGDPIYGALVYVPNAPVQPFTPGVACSPCGAEASGSPLVSTVTGIDGTFTLTDVPVGASIPIVIQVGRWRRYIEVPVNPCINNPLTATQTRLPRKEGELFPEDNIPLIAFDTGYADPMECILRKIGIDDSQYGDPTSPPTAADAPRVQFYADNGAAIDFCTPPAANLYDNPTTLAQYDMTIFACVGSQVTKTTTEQQNIIDYANLGGRVFTTHYSYVWLFNDWPFSTTAAWNVDQPFPSPDPMPGYIDETFPKGQALAQWLQLVGAGTCTSSPCPPGEEEIPVNQPRWDFDAVNAPAQQWLYRVPTTPPNLPLHYTFNTPVCTSTSTAPSCTPEPASSQCGRVLFSDFHVYATAGGPLFPSECMPNAPMSPQEKLLEFMLFDLSNCVTADKPPPVTCTPMSCAMLGYTCGMQGDGCGGIIDCGTCTPPAICGGGGKPGVCGGGCTPTTCAAQGISCGPAGDGCGGSLSCGTCTPPATCGGGGKPGVCGSSDATSCVPLTCAGQGISCGPAGDGCGGSLNCGTCVSPDTCGGGGTPGVCGAPSCTPQTCASLGYNCGAAGDGCGGLLECGTCTLPVTCGGGGKPNVCGVLM